MAEDLKKGFLLYFDYRRHLSLLSNEERGRLLMALFDYAETGKAPELEGSAVQMAFSFIASQLDRDAAKYAETCQKRREAGQKGGRPKKPKALNEKAKKANGFSENQRKAKKADTDTDTDNDTDKETEKKTETEAYMNYGGILADSPLFQKPTLNEIRSYCQEQNFHVDPERFYNYYEGVGWKLGKSPVVDWRAVLRNWEKSEEKTAVSDPINAQWFPKVEQF